MSRKMLINASHPEENRVAIVVDGILSELDIEIAGQLQTKGNIYKAVVVRVEPGLQAAFIDYGAERHGFLQTGEIHPDLHPPKKSESKEYPRINEILHRGQEILVQVVKGERGTKGAALTTFLSLPGRYMVLMPDSDTKGVSRKIEDEKERKTLKKTMAQLDLPDEMGYIVRTAGIGKEEVELKRDFNYLVSLYKGILARKEKVKAPAQLYQESDIVIRSIRDYFSIDMDEVLIDDNQVYQQARDFFSLVMPDQLHLVKQHREKRPIFSRYQIEEQIESLARNQVTLPSGGSIVIDQTEALVAIDVNSGRMGGEKGIEATAARSNIEAAAEIGRQLRLRDLGGLIVIDFIDMRDRKKVREVEMTLKESVQDDKARITLGKISQFGLLELSRQRIRPTLSVGAYLECPNCHGRGQIKSPEAQAVALLRQLHASVSKGHVGTIKAKVPLDVANYLHNEHRHTLSELEKRFDLQIKIIGSLEAIPEQIELDLIKREKVQIENADQNPVSHADGLEEALAAANAPIEVKSDLSVEAAEEEETTLSEAPETEEAAESPTGKRRRRRRRRKRNGSAEPNQTGELNNESATAPADATSETLLAVNEAGEVIPGPSGGAETPVEEKPKRRGRRPAKKVVAPIVEGPEALVESPVETAPSEEVKPKRRTRRPAAKKAASATQEPVVKATGDTSEATDQKADKANQQTHPPMMPKVADARPETTSNNAVNEIAATAPTQEKPKRRPRKPAAKKVNEVAKEETAARSEPKPVAIPAPQAPVEEKPKRRTRRPAAKKPQETTGESIVTKPEVGAETTTLESAPPKRRARRPVTKKTLAADNKTVSSQTEPSTDKAPAVEVKPKRRAPRPPAKKPADA